LPPVAEPDSSAKYPELPEFVVPLLRSRAPDVPTLPALTEANVNEPVPPLALPPPRTDTDPPGSELAIAEPP